jgi:hypothetical protein
LSKVISILLYLNLKQINHNLHTSHFPTNLLLRTSNSLLKKLYDHFYLLELSLLSKLFSINSNLCRKHLVFGDSFFHHNPRITRSYSRNKLKNDSLLLDTHFILYPKYEQNNCHSTINNCKEPTRFRSPHLNYYYFIIINYFIN